MKSKQFSKTAVYVAIKFYGLTQIKPYRELYDEEVTVFYDRLVAKLPAPLNSYHSLLKKQWFRSICINVEEFMLPGDLMHILMRKFCILSIVDRLIEKGYSQIVILGAGFDHIGKTYSETGVRCIELDTAPMVQQKKHFLKNHDYANRNLSVYPANVSDRSLSDILPEIPTMDPDAPTVVVAEGFFDYLTPLELSKTLRSLNDFYKNELKLVSTVFSLKELTPFHAMVFRYAVNAVGEKLKLDATLKEFKAYLGGNNFLVNRLWTTHDMRNGIAMPHDFEMAVLPGFYLLEATRNR